MESRVAVDGACSEHVDHVSDDPLREARPFAARGGAIGHARVAATKCPG